MCVQVANDYLEASIDSDVDVSASDVHWWGRFNISGLRRVGFQLKFRSDKLPAYLRDHEAVWPEMQEALHECGCITKPLLSTGWVCVRLL